MFVCSNKNANVFDCPVCFVPCAAPPGTAQYPPALLPVPQVLFMCGLLVLIFDVSVAPFLTPWLGIRTSQRATSAIAVPVFLAYPLLHLLHGTGGPLTAASVFLLSTTTTSSHVVCYPCTVYLTPFVARCVRVVMLRAASS